MEFDQKERNWSGLLAKQQRCLFGAFGKLLLRMLDSFYIYRNFAREKNLTHVHKCSDIDTHHHQANNSVKWHTCETFSTHTNCS